MHFTFECLAHNKLTNQSKIASRLAEGNIYCFHFLDEYHYTNSWSNRSDCNLYRPEDQSSSKIDHRCGNGYQYSFQDQCVMGENNLKPANIEYCPKPDYFVRSCYVPCSGMKFYPNNKKRSFNYINLGRRRSFLGKNLKNVFCTIFYYTKFI